MAGGGMGYVEYMDLSNNHLTGAIPDSLGNPDHLDLSHNNLTGTIPPALGHAVRLYESGTDYLDLSYNQLTGIVPTTLGNLGALGHLRLRGNGCLTTGGDEALKAWLDYLDPYWDDGCG